MIVKITDQHGGVEIFDCFKYAYFDEPLVALGVTQLFGDVADDQELKPAPGDMIEVFDGGICIHKHSRPRTPSPQAD